MSHSSEKWAAATGPGAAATENKHLFKFCLAPHQTLPNYIFKGKLFVLRKTSPERRNLHCQWIRAWPLPAPPTSDKCDMTVSLKGSWVEEECSLGAWLHKTKDTTWDLHRDVDHVFKKSRWKTKLGKVRLWERQGLVEGVVRAHQTLLSLFRGTSSENIPLNWDILTLITGSINQR